MPETIHTTRDLARLRNRRVVAAILLIALSVMVVRDLLVRRWGPGRAAAPDVTRRSS